MTAYKQAHGEHYTHDVVPFAEIILVRVSEANTLWSRRQKTLAQERRRVHQRCVGWLK